MKKQTPRYSKTSGAKFNPELHTLVVNIAKLRDLEVGQAYVEALSEWVRRQAASDSLIKGIVDRKCSQDDDLRLLMNTRPSAKSKAGLLS